MVIYMNKPILANELKNSRLYKELLLKINSGELKSGERIAPERELCKLYKCSRATVRESLRKLEELRLIEKRQGSGTYVTDRQANLNRTKKVGIVSVSNFENLYDDPYLSQVSLSFIDCANKNAVNPIFINLKEREELGKYISKIPQNTESFDGYIFQDSLNDDEIALLKDYGISFVCMMPSSGNMEISHVDIDNAGGLYMLTEYILACGRNSPLLFTGPLSLKTNRDKVDGFKNALKDAGIQFREEMVFEICSAELEPARSLTRKLLSSYHENIFDSVIVYGDWAAYGIFQAIQESGKRYPDDITVAMYGGYPWIQKALEIKFPYMKQPFSEQAEKSLKILLRKINYPSNSEFVETIQPRLTILRQR